MEVDRPRDEDSRMREVTEKRVYTSYTPQDKARFFKLKIDKCINASAAAKQLGIPVRTAQRWWEQTDMDFLTNLVILDESAFHINMERTMAWSKKGTPAVVTVPTTRAKTTAIQGAISASALINHFLVESALTVLGHSAGMETVMLVSMLFELQAKPSQICSSKCGNGFEGAKSEGQLRNDLRRRYSAAQGENKPHYVAMSPTG
ncbi:hypothetical protein VTP01DRAFT_2132 [Rhizomucor pusillus]|uniref:uncharacterized protein n=1 Tax=Rhizomucor pusillus TaxID=4840 RepID=UPI003742D705